MVKNKLQGLALSLQEKFLGWILGSQQPKVARGHRQGFRLWYHSFICIIQTSQKTLI